MSSTALWPRQDGDLARFMLRLIIRHARRWLIHRNQVGTGHIYQGRYKSFAVQNDAHLTTVCRYVERNPVRAGRVKSSVDRDWSSAGQSRLHADQQLILTTLPHTKRRDWVQWVDRPQTTAEEAALKNCIAQGRPYGSDKWLAHLKSTLGWRKPRKRGRPKYAPS